ncbi:HD domain-containing protein [Lutibacter sp. B2]|nr:HD domain-containing protein [Lutibacter sp. B2]
MEYRGKIIKLIEDEGITKCLFDILEQSDSHKYIRELDESFDILEKIFPESIPMKQVGRCDYHVVDTWTHSVNALEELEKIMSNDQYFEIHLKDAYKVHMNEKIEGHHTRMQLLKLAVLFHDVGKPESRWIDEHGKVRFRGHEIVGAAMAEKIAERLELKNKEKEYFIKMVREHMWPLGLYKKNDVSGKTLFDLFKRLKEDTLDLFLLGLADIIATRILLNPDEEMRMYKIHIEYIVNNYLTRFKESADLVEAIDKRDIKNRFNIRKKQLNKIIENAKEAIFEGMIPPQEEAVIRYIELNRRL